MQETICKISIQPGGVAEVKRVHIYTRLWATREYVDFRGYAMKELVSYRVSLDSRV